MITRHNVTVEFDSEQFHLWDTLEKELRDFLESRGYGYQKNSRI